MTTTLIGVVSGATDFVDIISPPLDSEGYRIFRDTNRKDAFVKDICCNECYQQNAMKVEWV